jgi:hypothetical protein
LIASLSEAGGAEMAMRGGVVEENEDRGGRGMDVEIRVGSKRILIYMYPEIREIRPLRLCSAFSADNSEFESSPSWI